MNEGFLNFTKNITEKVSSNLLYQDELMRKDKIVYLTPQDYSDFRSKLDRIGDLRRQPELEGELRKILKNQIQSFCDYQCKQLNSCDDENLLSTSFAFHKAARHLRHFLQIFQQLTVNEEDGSKFTISNFSIYAFVRYIKLVFIPNVEKLTNRFCKTIFKEPFDPLTGLDLKEMEMKELFGVVTMISEIYLAMDIPEIYAVFHNAFKIDSVIQDIENSASIFYKKIVNEVFNQYSCQKSGLLLYAKTVLSLVKQNDELLSPIFYPLKNPDPSNLQIGITLGSVGVLSYDVPVQLKRLVCRISLADMEEQLLELSHQFKEFLNNNDDDALNSIYNTLALMEIVEGTSTTNHGLQPYANIFKSWAIDKIETIFDVKMQEILPPGDDKLPHSPTSPARIILSLDYRLHEPVFEDPFIHNLWDLHESFKKISENNFKSHPSFSMAATRAFESLFMKEPYSDDFSNLLAVYCDKTLRNPLSNEKACMKFLEKIVGLFAFASEKECFIQKYWHLMGHRLLANRVETRPLESYALNLIKQKYGELPKLEGMLADSTKSDLAQQQFSKKTNHKVGDIEFSVRVFQKNFWPFPKVEISNLPIELANMRQTFEKFYKELNPPRKLTWYFNLGSCLIHWNLKDSLSFQTVRLKGCMIQAAILVLFNVHEVLTYREVIKLLGISATENVYLKKFLSILVKQNILSRKVFNSSGGEHEYTENKNFTPPDSLTVKLLQPSLEEAPAREKINFDEKKNRAIDFGIVRILKKKSMTYRDIQEILSDQLGDYDIELEEIKSRAEKCIEEGYIDRDENDINLLSYKINA
eukprot:GHVP01021235.1.p1 GENE.GHVP01021235.1~~GHVP01021235.1.p1  ORF type:complete len:811 (+),score=131.81 GHVP01021235.1:68-2500(+)